jgi:acyl dehydratase
MKKYWDKVEIGHSLTPLNKKPISRLHLAQFAAASDDFSPLHLDDEYAKGAGFGSVFVPNLMALGLAEDALRAYAHNAYLVSLSGTFQRMMWPGDALTAKGVIVRHYKNHSEHRVQFSVWVENQNKEVVMKGQAIITLFKNPEEETSARESTPALAKETQDALIKKCEKLTSSARAVIPTQTIAPREMA